MYNNQIETSYTTPTYPVHLVVGGAGCDTMNAQVDEAAANGTIGKTDPQWLAMHDKDYYGMGVLKVVSHSELQWTWYASVDGSVLDTMTLTKKH